MTLICDDYSRIQSCRNTEPGGAAAPPPPTAALVKAFGHALAADPRSGAVSVDVTRIPRELAEKLLKTPLHQLDDAAKLALLQHERRIDPGSTGGVALRKQLVSTVSARMSEAIGGRSIQIAQEIRDTQSALRSGAASRLSALAARLLGGDPREAEKARGEGAALVKAFGVATFTRMAGLEKHEGASLACCLKSEPGDRNHGLSREALARALTTLASRLRQEAASSSDHTVDRSDPWATARRYPATAMLVMSRQGLQVGHGEHGFTLKGEAARTDALSQAAFNGLAGRLVRLSDNRQELLALGVHLGLAAVNPALGVAAGVTRALVGQRQDLQTFLRTTGDVLAGTAAPAAARAALDRVDQNLKIGIAASLLAVPAARAATAGAKGVLGELGHTGHRAVHVTTEAAVNAVEHRIKGH